MPFPTYDPHREAEALKTFQILSRSPATKRIYDSDLRIFEAWCLSRGLRSLPAEPDIVAAFLTHEALRGKKPATISRRMAAISYALRVGALPAIAGDERIKSVLRGIRRYKGVAPKRKAPATAERVVAMAAAGDDGIRSLRDRAIVLLGFAGAFRRSELVALDVEDIAEFEEGLRVSIRRSKTDQEGLGATIGILRGDHACPVRALTNWLHNARITSGAIFRQVSRSGTVSRNRLSDRSVALIVKARAKAVGLDPSTFSGHSLRAGFLTSAAARGASIFKMMDVSRHKSVDTLRGYVRDAELFKSHAGRGLL